MRESKYRVLVVDDDGSTVRRLADFLAREGFEVVQAQEGSQALDVFSRERPHIVLADYRMHGLNGLELLEKVKRLAPTTQFILITGFGDTEVALSALEHGAIDYLKKPLDLTELLVALGRARELLAEAEGTADFPSLLVAEDDDTARRRLARVLRDEDYVVHEAGDGREAVKVYRCHKVDLVLLDIRMPGLDGLSALHEMRRISSDVEAIIVSGYGDEASAVKAMRNGAMGFIRKPIDLNELLAMLDVATEKLKLRRALKYRLRELELSRQVIAAAVTDDRQILVDMRRHRRPDPDSFARELVDSIPVALLVAGGTLEVRYSNANLRQELGPHKRVDASFVDSLAQIGIKVSLDEIATAVQSIAGGEGEVRTFRFGEFAAMTLIPIMLVGESVQETVVLMTLRGGDIRFGHFGPSS